jgi:hypothetical protein
MFICSMDESRAASSLGALLHMQLKVRIGLWECWAEAVERHLRVHSLRKENTELANERPIFRRSSRKVSKDSCDSFSIIINI